METFSSAATTITPPRWRLEPGHDILLPSGICRNRRHYRIWSHGGTHKVLRLSSVQPRHVPSSTRLLFTGLGAAAHRADVNRRCCVLRLRRFGHRSHGRRYRRPHGSNVPGPRIGKYSPDGTPRAIPGHNIPFAILGVFILWLGWFGFNPGSELAADQYVMSVAVNTMLAATAGALFSAVTIWLKAGKPDVAMVGNGALAGLVAITAPCGTVDPSQPLSSAALAASSSCTRCTSSTR